MERDWDDVTQASILKTNFNSHAHVERDSNVNDDSRLRNISTHTLTWSVTKMRKGGLNKLAISTHTLTWSVTLALADFATGWINFNSHAHVERDVIQLSHNEWTLNFNSHAHVERDR